MGSTKEVSIQITPADLQSLKKNNYHLCFAKKVNDGYNVVWWAGDYLMYNTFQIPSKPYKVFGASDFKEGRRVQATTNAVNIGLGQQVTLDEHGDFQSAVRGDLPNSLTFHNDYGAIHLAISADANGSVSPIFVAKAPIMPGKHIFTPVESVMVWFEQHITTGTMFSSARPEAVEIDLTQHNEITYSYAGGKWKLGPLS